MNSRLQVWAATFQPQCDTLHTCCVWGTVHILLQVSPSIHLKPSPLSSTSLEISCAVPVSHGTLTQVILASHAASWSLVWEPVFDKECGQEICDTVTPFSLRQNLKAFICAFRSSFPLPLHPQFHPTLDATHTLSALDRCLSVRYKNNGTLFLYQLQFNREEGWKLAGYLKACLIIQENTSCCVYLGRTNHKREYGKV